MAARLLAPGAVADLRASLLAAGLLRVGAEPSRLPDRGCGSTPPAGPPRFVTCERATMGGG